MAWKFKLFSKGIGKSLKIMEEIETGIRDRDRDGGRWNSAGKDYKPVIYSYVSLFGGNYLVQSSITGVGDIFL